MNRKITVASQKGGVGKTTTVLNLGYALSRGGDRVLLVDADPQGGLGHATHLAERAKGGIVQVLRGGLPLDEAITPTRDERLGILGCGVEGPEDVQVLEAAARDGSLGFLLATIPDGWDTTLVDAPAGTGALLHALLVASDGMIAVTSPKMLSVRGIPSLLRAHELAEQENPALRFDGLLLAMLDGAQRSDWEVRAQLRRELPAGTLFRTAIPFDLGAEGASQRCVPLALAERAERAAGAYAELAAELRARLTTDSLALATEEERQHGLF